MNKYLPDIGVRVQIIIAIIGLIYYTNVFFQAELYKYSVLPSFFYFFLIIYLSRFFNSASIIIFGTLISLAVPLYVGSALHGDQFSNNYDVLQLFLTDRFLVSLMDSKSPAGILYYALFVKLFGNTLIVTYVAPIIAWFSGSVLIFLSLKHKLQDRTRKVILSLLIFYPSFIVFSSVYSFHAVFHLYFGLSFFALSRIELSRNIAWSALFGFSAGLLFYTRSNGLFIWVIIFLSCFIVSIKLQRKELLENFLRFIFIPLLIFLIVVSTYSFLHFLIKNELVISSTKNNSYYLLYGTNHSSAGRWNQADLDLAGYPNKANNSKAFEIAVDRITKDPLAFLKFSITSKIKTLWGGGENFFYYHKADIGKDRLGILEGYKVLSLSAHSLTIILTIALCIFLIFRPFFIGSLYILISLVLSFPHIFIEVMEAYTIPIIAILIISFGMFGEAVNKLINDMKLRH